MSEREDYFEHIAKLNRPMKAFRPVIIKCAECGCTKETNGQMEAGLYEWECSGCNKKTAHHVTDT